MRIPGRRYGVTRPEAFVFSSPAVANGIVYVGSLDHNVYALNANTGTKVWSYTTGYWVVSSPAVANGIVYVGSNDHNVYALNAKPGRRCGAIRPETGCIPPPPSPTESSMWGAWITTSTHSMREPGSWCGAIRPETLCAPPLPSPAGSDRVRKK